MVKGVSDDTVSWISDPDGCWQVCPCFNLYSLLSEIEVMCRVFWDLNKLYSDFDPSAITNIRELEIRGTQ